MRTSARIRRAGSRACSRTIERVAPDSLVFEIQSSIDDGAAGPAAPDRSTKLMLEALESDDPARRAAALHDLGGIVAMFPENPYHRVSYAFALSGNSRADEALAEVRKAASVAGTEHNIHFNLAQIFLICGEQDDGRRHLDLANEYATTDEERADVAGIAEQYGLP